MSQKLESLLKHIARHSHNGTQAKPVCAHCSGVEILAREALEALASHAPSNDWPFIRSQFQIEFGVPMETKYGGDMLNLMMSIRELLKKAEIEHNDH